MLQHNLHPASKAMMMDAGQKSSSQTALFVVVSGDGCYIFFVYFGTKPDRSCRMMCENFGRVTIYDSVCFMSTFFNNNGALAPTHTHTRQLPLPHTQNRACHLASHRLQNALTEGQAPAKHSFPLIMPAITGSTLQQLAPRAAEGAC